jgi:SagB-type dehydrogenase family enzyme
MSRASARPPRLRRSTAIVAWPRGPWIVVQNYVLERTAAWRGPALSLLPALGHWTSIGGVTRRLRALGDPDPAATVLRLVRGGVLVAERSKLARQEALWRRTWRWGPLAAAFHRSLRDVRFRSEEVTQARLARRARVRPPPAVMHEAGSTSLGLPEPRVRRGVLAHLLRRESVREMSRAPVSRQEIADVLFAGLGVRGILRDPLQGDLPLKLAPSGGARNPIDGYLLALRIQGLPPGAYRYSGWRRDLEPVAPGPGPLPRDLLGGQEWADDASAVVFLVASFGRAMWKYDHPLSLRMVLLEAGHIAQNLLVAAGDAGLAAWPSGAISDSRAEAALGVSGPDRSVLYAVVLGRRRGEASPHRARRSRSSASSARGGEPGSASLQARPSRSRAARASGRRPRASSARARSRRLRG